ncbi:MAG: T9SS C-terminal target domain-containing protein, partial [Bacteroidia bacterium]|nr:T9SS C-terminal target domain-containing protein [Bacteroidia bacterium]
ATPGTNGGGIIIIKSNVIQASGGSIKAFANDAVFTSGDGSGGGGAGGTVLLHTNNITGNLTIDVHGGKGGDNSGHGPGGGGGG